MGEGGGRSNAFGKAGDHEEGKSEWGVTRAAGN